MCFNSNPIVFSRLIVVIDDHLVSVAVGHDRHTISPAMVGYNSAAVFSASSRNTRSYSSIQSAYSLYSSEYRPFESV